MSTLNPLPIASLAPNIQRNYTNFILLDTGAPETLGYFDFQATSLSTNQVHNIRAFNLDSRYSKQDKNRAISLFLQETLRLTSTNPQTLFLETLEFHENRICYATKPTVPILLRKSGSLRPKLDIPKLLKNVLTDIDLLSTKANHKIDLSTAPIHETEATKASVSYFLKDWNKVLWPHSTLSEFRSSVSIMNTIESLGLKEDSIYSLILSILELNGENIEEIRSLRKYSSTMHDSYILMMLRKRIFKKHHCTPKLVEILYQLLKKNSSKMTKVDHVLQELNRIEGLNQISDQERNLQKFNEAQTKIDEKTQIDPEPTNDEGDRDENSLEKEKLGSTDLKKFRSEIVAPLLSKQQQIHPKVRELMQHGSPLEIEEVNLWGSRIGDIGATTLSMNKRWTKLTSLVLHGNEISDRGIVTLSKSGSWADLTILNLSNNSIGDKGAITLSKNSTWKKLAKLNLGTNSIGAEGAIALSENDSWIQLTTLDLGNNAIGAKGAAALGKNSSWAKLKVLNLSYNSIGAEGAASLSLNSSWINLTTLNLDYNSIGVEGAKALSKNSSWKNLTTLYLEKNSIGSEGTIALSKNRSWRKLKALDLGKNPIDAKGAIALCENSSWVHLMVLDLRNNSIEAEAAKVFIKIRPNLIVNI